MNLYIKGSLILAASFLISGCSIYRQRTVLEVPYNPGTKVPLNNSATVNNKKVINETLTTGNAFTDVKDSVKPNTQVIQPKTIVQRIPFPVAEYKSLATTGSATVNGNIFVTTASGKRVYGKNTRLYLNPVTSYSTQWFNKSYLGGAKMSKVDSRLFNYLKFTTSDSSGKFEFLNVPSGSYYLIGVVKCGTSCGYDKIKNIRIAKKISVFGNDIKTEDLTKSVN